MTDKPRLKMTRLSDVEHKAGPKCPLCGKSMWFSHYAMDWLCVDAPTQGGSGGGAHAFERRPR